LELFNLQDDPGETKNLAAALPTRTQALQAKLNTWRQETDAQPPTANPGWKPASKNK
jgi:hypothetical protein